MALERGPPTRTRFGSLTESWGLSTSSRSLRVQSNAVSFAHPQFESPSEEGALDGVRRGASKRQRQGDMAFGAVSKRNRRHSTKRVANPTDELASDRVSLSSHPQRLSEVIRSVD